VGVFPVEEICFGAEQRRRLPTAVKKCVSPSVSCSRDLFVVVVVPQFFETGSFVDDGGFNRSVTDCGRAGRPSEGSGKRDEFSSGSETSSARCAAVCGKPATVSRRPATLSESNPGDPSGGDKSEGVTTVAAVSPPLSAGENVFGLLV